MARGERLGVQCLVAVHHRIEAKMMQDARTRDASVARARRSISQSVRKCARQRDWILWGHETVFQLRPEHCSVAADVSDDRAESRTHCFEQRDRRTFAVG